MIAFYRPIVLFSVIFSALIYVATLQRHQANIRYQLYANVMKMLMTMITMNIMAMVTKPKTMISMRAK
jgi:hypothetical protein